MAYVITNTKSTYCFGKYGNEPIDIHHEGNLIKLQVDRDILMQHTFFRNCLDGGYKEAYEYIILRDTNPDFLLLIFFYLHCSTQTNDKTPRLPENDVNRLCLYSAGYTHNPPPSNYYYLQSISYKAARLSLYMELWHEGNFYGLDVFCEFMVRSTFQYLSANNNIRLWQHAIVYWYSVDRAPGFGRLLAERALKNGGFRESNEFDRCLCEMGFANHVVEVLKDKYSVRPVLGEEGADIVRRCQVDGQRPFGRKDFCLW
ncbi:hypothetical protein P280DRAFT_546621 [Massarina eburnea CBS 473.64]|uniref:BTB domain-containing protein n=1 Tax=Massarina eburnea CBS 473.64 TaxID=1395130 RepID=A0A6A6S919_9PLEO|nr:hypothetical protein P280DRAFT_546621 [Massarina eburnea CBS 473.64]